MHFTISILYEQNGHYIKSIDLITLFKYLYNIINYSYNEVLLDLLYLRLWIKDFLLKNSQK